MIFRPKEQLQHLNPETTSSSPLSTEAPLLAPPHTSSLELVAPHLEIAIIERNKVKGPYNFQGCTTCLTKFNGSLGSLDKNFETNIQFLVFKKQFVLHI